MTDPIEEHVEEPIEEEAQSTEEILREIRDELTGLRADVDQLLNETTEGAQELEEDTLAPIKEEHSEPEPSREDKPDPYMKERQPVRRHGLFRRIFNG